MVEAQHASLRRVAVVDAGGGDRTSQTSISEELGRVHTKPVRHEPLGEQNRRGDAIDATQRHHVDAGRQHGPLRRARDQPPRMYGGTPQSADVQVIPTDS